MNMRILLSILVIVTLAFSFGACKSSSGPAPFCDTTCTKDSLKFNNDHPLKPYVSISIRNCKPDTITWSHTLLATNRKMGFMYLVGKDVTLNKDYVSCYFKDTSYAWLKFNDCITGRGFLVKLPFDKSGRGSNYTSALNNFDPKFVVADDLIAYYNETTVFVQDLATGVEKRVRISDKPLEIDHNKVHKTFDSVNISRTRVFVNVMLKGELTPIEKSIELDASNKP
jgi:hypothetical protein